MQITEKKSELGKLEVIDCGKPLDEALWDMVCLWYCQDIELNIMYIVLCVGILVVQDDVAGCFEYYADLAEGLDAKQKAPVSLPMETFKSYVLKEPLGVVALITPWYLLLHYVISLCPFYSLLFNVYLFVIKFSGLGMPAVFEIDHHQ